MNEPLNIGGVDLPVIAIFLVLLGNLLVYLVLKLVKRYLFVLIPTDFLNQYITKAWSRIELVIWVLVMVLSMVYLLNQSYLVTLVILAVILTLGSRYWKDAIAGITLKFENRIAIGDYLSSDAYSGVVEYLGFRGTQIRMDNGEHAFILYRSLHDFKVRKLARELTSEMSSVLVKFKAEIPVEIAVQKLKEEVLNIPYTMLTYPVQVEVVEVDDLGTTLRAIIHTQSSQSGKLAEKSLGITLTRLKLLAS